MKEDLKKSAPVFLTVYGIAILVTVFARIGCAVMDSTGVLSYNYRAATAPYLAEGSTLDQVCWTLTGGTLVGFMFAAGVAFALAVATALIFGHLFSRRDKGSVGTALVWGLATAIVSFACLAVTVAGLYSHVLLSQMTSKGGGMGAVPVLLVLTVATFVAATSLMIRNVLSKDSRRARAVGALSMTLACGLVVCVLVIGTFGAVNAHPATPGHAAGWLCACVAANSVMMCVAARKRS